MKKTTKNRQLLRFFRNVTRRSKFIAVLIVLGLFGTSLGLAIQYQNSNIVVKNSHGTNRQPRPTTPSSSERTEDTRTSADSDVPVTNAPSSMSGSSSTAVGPGQSAQKPMYDNSTALPPAQVAPFSDFSIVISPWSVTHLDHYNIQVPFAIKHIGSHTASITSLSGQVIPTISGLSCSPAFSQGELGEIHVYASSTVPLSQYTCRVTMCDGTITRTAQFTFTVTGTEITTP